VKVLHLATFDAHGGAAVAALRLIDSLRRRGHDAGLLVREKVTAHPAVEAVTGRDGARPSPQTDAAVSQLAWLFTRRARTSRSDTPFSADFPTSPVADHPAVRTADVLHLHWVAGWLSAYEIRRLQDLGKPIVWTLHDQFPFTGGCHYAQSCRGFVRSCASCPQLQPGAQRLASLTLAQKRDLIDPKRLRVTAPSRWLAKCARESALFRTSRIDVVPNGLDVISRRTMSRAEARQALAIPADAIVVFASSVNNRETRKGDAHLVEALHRLPPDRRVLVLTAGEGAHDGVIAGFAARTLGTLTADDPRLLQAYRAADVFVLPSLEDNLPNTLLEAMAAEVPVVAYRTGGIPELLEDGISGRVVRRGDVKALADALGSLLSNEVLRRRMGAAAGASALAKVDWSIQAAEYVRIYTEELARIGRVPVASRRRRLKTFAQDPLADASTVKALLTDRAASQLFTTVLRQEIEELQDVIAARGGEIRDLKTVVAQREQDAHELQTVIASRGGEIRELKRALAENTTAAADRADTLLRLMRSRERSGPTVGIFGVGDGGRRVLEAVAVLEGAVDWFADNDVRAQGRMIGGCQVIAPETIPGRAFDFIVIGSVHRDAIREQLRSLGIPQDKVVAPDVSLSTGEFVEELRRQLSSPALRSN
jgi:glycosyltransferase involved in cell wall biosynthesis